MKELDIVTSTICVKRRWTSDLLLIRMKDVRLFCEIVL